MEGYRLYDMRAHDEMIERAWRIVQEKLKEMDARGVRFGFTGTEIYTLGSVSDADRQTLDEAHLIFFKNRLPETMIGFPESVATKN